ncbi:dimethyl sulfoxide reductase anchor subunit [Rhodobacterales bacterium HKCCE3408]|nr:dimethyl sulfoxide reductase anchor subunit [Rhodobacterales bacterium HKCCE3408]
MHPATSIIVFTVASGAGFGLMAALGLSGPLPVAMVWTGYGIAFVLAVAGLLSSTLHLGHPERAWRAFSQWRSSWLSREGVMSIVTLALAAAHALALLTGHAAAVWLGPVSAVCALLTVFTTAMIYTQIKAVDRWHTRLTPACFLLFSMASGAILAATLRAVFLPQGAAAWPLLAAILTFAAWMVRQRAWARGDGTGPRSTPETATGLGGLGKVRLFESPHTGPNYLLREMGFVVARRHAAKLRLIALALGAVVPLLATLLASGGALPAFMLALGSLSLLAGLLIERWLFFAEARHAVMAWYDRTIT